MKASHKNKTSATNAYAGRAERAVSGICILLALAVVVAVVLWPSNAAAAENQPGQSAVLPDIQSRSGVTSIIKWIALITVLSLAPAVVVLVTSFTRIIVVLGLLRQALTTQQVPPNQVLFGLALLLTALVMAPAYENVHRDAVKPYFQGSVTQAQALKAGEKHIRSFMIDQLENTGNQDEVYPFLDESTANRQNLTWGDVPTISLVPAFVVSELKTAFTMGFRIYLPFVVVDLLVASVLVSMGMLMVPPALISLPFKLLLFVLADGWGLVVGTLIKSFG